MQKIVRRSLLVLMVAACCLQAAAQVSPSVLEYWLDRNWNGRQQVATNGTKEMTIDVGSLCPGIHTLEMRIGDSKGRWGTTVVRYFLKARPTIEDNQLKEFAYWIDGDLAHATRIGVSKAAAFDIDVSHLRKGIHTLSYTVTDKRGLACAATTLYFLVPHKAPANIVAYEYWFNGGERKRVDVSPQNPLALENVVIELSECTPRQIAANYRFDAKEMVVYCPEKVTFGLQAVDDKEHRSAAVVSSTFDAEIPIAVGSGMIKIADGETKTVEPLSKGAVQGMETACAKDDVLRWTLKGGLQNFDLFEADGTRAEFTVETLPDGGRVYKAKALSTKMYALLYNNASLTDESQVSLSCEIATGINEIASTLTIVEVTDLAGIQYPVRSKKDLKRLMPGVYVVRLTDGKTETVRKIVMD